MYKTYYLYLLIILLLISCSNNIDILIEKGEYTKAIDILTERIENNHRREDYIKLISIYNEYLHLFDKAIEVGEHYHKYYNSYDNINILLSIVYYNKSKELFEDEVYDSSLLYIDKALTLNNYYEKAYILKSLIYVNSNKYERADSVLNKLKMINPDNKKIYLIKGNIYLKKEQYNKALNQYLKALKLDSTFAEAWANLGVLYYLGDYTAYAMDAFKKSIKYDSVSIIAYDYLIKIFYDGGMQDSAYKYMQLYDNNKKELLKGL